MSHFVKAESCTPSPDCSEPPHSFFKFAKINDDWHYVTYPASLEREFQGGITRVWARKVLEDLERLGILDHIDLRPPRRKGDTPHYYLRKDYKAAASAISSLSKLLVSDYELFRGLRHLINEEFVANVLADKGYVMHRSLKLWSLGASEMEELFLTLRPQMGSADIRDLRDYMLQSLRYVYDDDVQDDVTAPFNLPLSLPLMHHRDLDIDRIVTLNPNYLHHDAAESNEDGVLDRIQDHYRFHQRSHVILPIMYLLAKSPSALIRFVTHPPAARIPDPEHTFHGTDALNDLIFQLITATISDMASFGDDTGSKCHVALRPVRQKDGSEPLMMVTDGTMDILYDASFDTSRRQRHCADATIAGQSSSFLDVRTVMDVSPYSGLSPEDILDFDRFIREMRRGHDPLLRSLLEALPNRFRNVVELLGPGVHWYDRLRSDFILYLNLALMEMDLLQSSVIPEGALSEEHRKQHEWAILNDRGFDGYELLRSNVNILRTMYPGIIRKR